MNTTNRTQPLTPRERYLVITLIISLFVTVISLIYVLRLTQAGITLNPLRNEVIALINTHSQKELPSEEDIRIGEIKGIVGALDDRYSVYYKKSERELFNRNLNNEFVGIGIRFQTLIQGARIVEIFEDSPASRSGLKADDIIVEVEGISLTGLGNEQISGLIKGPANTEVQFGILRDGASLQLTSLRNAIVPKLTSLERLDAAFYLTIRSFGVALDKEIMNHALVIDNELKTCVENCPKGIIIDFRGNSGGLLDQSVDFVSYFVEPDTIVLNEINNTQTKEVKSVKREPRIALPIFVLIDAYSASASEISAIALKEHNKAVILGQKSFGKGSVQELFLLSNGDTIKITIAEWRSPAGVIIEGIGITPDIIVPPDQSSLDIALTLIQ